MNVCGRFVFGDLIFVDKVHGVGSSGHFRVFTKALEHATNFFDVGDFPSRAFAALAKFAVFQNVAGVGVDSSAM